jgi:glycosyltransferase involved in cell wall biosynthesis
MKKIKILQVCPYSSGICGVFQRVKQDSIDLEKIGYSICSFSSNITKGTNEISKPEDNIGNIKIKRFKATKLGGESYMYWNYKNEALKLKPDIIIVHNYRHLHTTQALKIKKKLERKGHNCKVFLVTHAPFVKKNTSRTKVEELIVDLYDRSIGRKTINKFDKIITITSWENIYLQQIGCKKEKIIKIPNGVPNIFFKEKISYPKNKIKKILFLGRIAPIKNIETIVNISNKINANFEIVGPYEKKYYEYLKNMIKEKKVNNIFFKKPIYDIKQKIKLIDSADIFILTSKREAFPQGLLEAMARGRIVISSDTDGPKEIITDNKNGFLYPRDDLDTLIKKINYIFKLNKKQKEKIQKEAIKKAMEYNIEKNIEKLERLF